MDCEWERRGLCVGKEGRVWTVSGEGGEGVDCEWGRRGGCGLSGLVMKEGKVGVRCDVSPLTPSLPPISDLALIECHDKCTESRYIRSVVCTNLHNSRLINGIECMCMSQC